MTKILLYPVVAFAWLAVAENAFVLAADVEWNQKGTAWEDPNNWSGGKVPGPDDIAVFPSLDELVKNQPTVAGTVRVGGIVLNNGKGENIVEKAIPDYYEGKNEGCFTYLRGGEYAWIINGSGKIEVGKGGIRVSGKNSIIYPSLMLAADQEWNIGQPAVARSSASYSYRWRAYQRTLMKYHEFYRAYCKPDLVVFGVISGPGGIQKQGQGSIWYINEGSPAFSGGTCVREGLIVWRPPQPGEYAFGSGQLTLDGGGFRFAGMREAADVIHLKNSIRVMPHGGEIQSRSLFNNKLKADAALDGALELGGLLRLTFSDPGMTFNGPRIILFQEEPASPGIVGPATLNRLSMPIVDGPGGAGNPLILESHGVLTLSGTENSYRGPTVISAPQVGCYGSAVDVAAEGRLGQGDLIVEPGGRIHLSGPGNLSAGAKAFVGSNPRALGVLGVGYNGIPKITEDSSGVLAVDCENFDAVSDMSKLGNGRMYMGSRDKGTFVGTALAPGKDNVYRLGGGSYGGIPVPGWGKWANSLASNDLSGNPSGSYPNAPGGGLLVIERGVLGGNADVTVGAMRTLGNGAVLLKSEQSFSGLLTVQGPAQCDWFNVTWLGSSLTGMAQSQKGLSPFGSPTGPVRLLNGTIKLAGVPGGQPVAKGELTFAGLSTIGLAADLKDQVCLTLAKLIREGRASLIVDSTQEAIGNREKLIVADKKADVDLLPPYCISREGSDFLSYDVTGGKGFCRFANYVTDLAKATDKDVVKLNTGALPGGGHTVHNLKVDGLVTGTDRFRIVGGGLILGGALSADVDFGEAEGLIFAPRCESKNRDGKTDTLNMSGKISGSNGVTISGAGVPVFFSNMQNDFRGSVTVNGASLRAIEDQYENGVFTPGTLGDLKNDIVLNGGILWWSGDNAKRCVAPTRTIYLGPGGGCLGGVNGRVEWRGAAPMYIHAKITGPGFFSQWVENSGGGVIITNGENDYSGGTWINMTDDQGMETTVSETGKLGTGAIWVGMDAGLVLQGDKNIDSDARLSLAYTGVASFESRSPVIGSLDGTGFVFLGVRSAPAVNAGRNSVFRETDLPVEVGHDTTLTLGTDGTDFTFYGTIQQRGEKAGDGIGSVTKTGKGVFTLYGGHSYTGLTTVEQGTLILKGSVAGDVTVKKGATFVLKGKVAGKVTVEDGGIFQDESKNKK